MKRWGLYLVTFAAIIIIWQWQAVQMGKSALFPFPRDVLSTLVTLLSQSETYLIIMQSMGRLILSIILATAGAVLLGLIAGFSDTVSTLLRPVVTSLRTLPVASLIVIILIIAGHTRSLYIITFLMIFPLIFEASRQGVLNISLTLKRALAIEKVPFFKKLFRVYLPLAFPYIKTGFLQSIGLGFKVLVMAEFIAQSPDSIGNMLYRGRVNFQYDEVFAWTIILIIIVTFIEFALNRLRTYKA